MGSKAKGGQPVKKKRIMTVILGLTIGSIILLTAVISFLMVIALSLHERADTLAMLSLVGKEEAFLLCDMEEMEEAWLTGEENESVSRFAELTEQFLEFMGAFSSEEEDIPPLKNIYILIPDGQGGYRYGGGSWSDAEETKAFMSPAELSLKTTQLLNEDSGSRYITLDLERDKKSVLNIDLVCLSFDLENGEVAYYCADTAVRGIYKYIQVNGLKEIFEAVSLIILIAIVLLAVGLGLLLRCRIAVPLVRLENSVKSFVTGTHLESDPEKWEYEAPKKYRQDEIGSLTDSVSDMAENMKRTTIRLLSEMKEKEKRTAELEMAAKIQQDALPSQTPELKERQEVDIFASMRPAKEVGGDFYDFFLTDEDHLWLVMADVSDKGMPAALFMMMSKILIRNLASRNTSPAKVLERANAIIRENNGENMFVTVWIGVLRLSDGLLTCANAGHLDPVVRRADGETGYITDKHGFVLGARKNRTYQEYEHQLERGDLLFTYTDGVTEAMNAGTELFGTERLLKAVSAAPEHEILSCVQEKLEEFTKDAEQSDDITMLAVRYKG